MDPLTLMMAGTAISGAMSGAANASAPQGPQSIFTPEMLQNALNQMAQYQSGQNALYGTGSTGPGGVQTTQARQLGDQEIKSREYVKYLQSKGYSADNAQKMAQAIVADPKKTFFQDKGFMDYVKAGNAQGLSTNKAGKRIKSAPEFQSGGAAVSPESENLFKQFQGLSGEALGAASGLPGAFAQDLRSALGARQNLGGMAQNYLAQGFNQSGLLQGEQDNLDALKAKYLQEFGNIYNDTMRQTAGGLQSSGFASSSLANDVLQRGAYDPQSRFLTDAMGKLAEIESGLVDQRFNRQTQNLNSILNTFNTLGANQGIGSVLGAVNNPNQAGLFNDVQSAQLAAQLQQNNIQNRQQDQSMANQINTMPVTVSPQGPGFFSSLAAGLGPAIGMASMMPYLSGQAKSGETGKSGKSGTTGTKKSA
jgi:hypothetical protein